MLEHPFTLSGVFLTAIRFIIDQLPAGMLPFVVAFYSRTQVRTIANIDLAMFWTSEHIYVEHRSTERGIGGLTKCLDLSALVTCHTLYVVFTTWQSAVFLLNSR